MNSTTLPGITGVEVPTNGTNSKNNNSDKHKLDKIFLLILIIILLAIIIYALVNTRKQNTGLQPNASLSNTAIPNSPAPSINLYAGWITYTNKSDWYKFSLQAPPGSFVCFSATATGGSDYDRPLAGTGSCNEGYYGIYLQNLQYYPYGVSLTYTSLDTESPNSIAQAFTGEYMNAVDSDIDFGSNFQKMVTGKETKNFIDRNGNEFSREVYYTKYYFTTANNEIYMPKIYTDANKTNYSTYQLILRSWKFTE